MSTAQQSTGGPLVFDFGHHALKVGYAGEDCPMAQVPSVAGVVEQGGMVGEIGIKEASSSTNDKYFIGTDLLNTVNKDMEVVGCVKDGMIDDWDVFENILNYTYANCIKSKSQLHPVLMSEAPWNVEAKRDKLKEIMFEKFNVPAFYLAKTGSLAAFASGRTTAIVIDCGSTHTSAVPVYDGYCQLHGIVKGPHGGDFLTMRCKQLFEDQDIQVVPSHMIDSEDQAHEPGVPKRSRKTKLHQVTKSWYDYMVKEVICDFKVNCLQVSETPYDKERLSTIPAVNYEFPDGTRRNFGADRFAIAEALFEPNSIKEANETVLGVADIIAKSVAMCDTGMRQKLYSNVVVTGGNSLVRGFTERLKNDLHAKAPEGMVVKIFNAGASDGRRFGSWVGGSILACLETFQPMWISRKDYMEGNKVIH